MDTPHQRPTPKIHMCVRTHTHRKGRVLFAPTVLSSHTYCLSQGYHDLLARCDFGDPTHNSLDSIHPYFKFHGALASQPRALKALIRVSGHVSGYRNTQKAEALESAGKEKEKKFFVFK